MNVHILLCKLIQKNSRPEYISLGKHQQSSRLFLLDPYAWKQWVEGHFISRKRARLSVHIVSMMAIYFARVAGQVCIIEWRLIDKNNRKRYFSILNVVERCTGCAAWLHWILIFLGVGWGDMQCSAVKPSFPAFFFLPFPCFFCILHKPPSAQQLRWFCSYFAAGSIPCKTLKRAWATKLHLIKLELLVNRHRVLSDQIFSVADLCMELLVFL